MCNLIEAICCRYVLQSLQRQAFGFHNFIAFQNAPKYDSTLRLSGRIPRSFALGCHAAVVLFSISRHDLIRILYTCFL